MWVIVLVKLPLDVLVAVIGVPKPAAFVPAAALVSSVAISVAKLATIAIVSVALGLVTLSTVMLSLFPWWLLMLLSLVNSVAHCEAVTVLPADTDLSTVLCPNPRTPVPVPQIALTLVTKPL